LLFAHVEKKQNRFRVEVFRPNVLAPEIVSVEVKKVGTFFVCEGGHIKKFH